MGGWVQDLGWRLKSGFRPSPTWSWVTLSSSPWFIFGGTKAQSFTKSCSNFLHRIKEKQRVKML